VPEKKFPRALWWTAGAVLLGILLLFAAKSWWEQSVQPATNSPAVMATPIPHRKLTLQYAAFRTRKGDTQLLTSFERIQQWDVIHFEVQMPYDGTVYLLYEGQKGELTWMNPDPDSLPQIAECLKRTDCRWTKRPGVRIF
jgi:hypothetical protein